MWIMKQTEDRKKNMEMQARWATREWAQTVQDILSQTLDEQSLLITNKHDTKEAASEFLEMLLTAAGKRAGR